MASVVNATTMSHMSSAASARHQCPECGAEVAGGQARCWLCERKLHGPEPINPYAPPPSAAGNVPSQFSLASLLLIVTLVAVGVGLFRLAPGLGVLLAFFSLPALARTTIDVTKHKQRGAPLGVLGKVGSFVVSLVVVLTVTVAALAASFTVCAVGLQATERLPQVMLFIAFGGLGVGLLVMSWLFWLTRPRG